MRHHSQSAKKKESKIKCLMSLPLLMMAMMRAGPHKASFCFESLRNKLLSSSDPHQVTLFPIFSDILSAICILSHIFSVILSDILSNISSEIHCG